MPCCKPTGIQEIKDQRRILPYRDKHRLFWDKQKNVQSTQALHIFCLFDVTRLLYGNLYAPAIGKLNNVKTLLRSIDAHTV